MVLQKVRKLNFKQPGVLYRHWDKTLTGNDSKDGKRVQWTANEAKIWNFILDIFYNEVEKHAYFVLRFISAST